MAAGLEAGKWVLLEIDVQGALAVVEKYPDAITSFSGRRRWRSWRSGSADAGPRDEEAIQRRLAQARRELALAGRYSHQVVNEEGSEQRAAQEICEILKRERRSTVMLDELKEEAIVKKVGGRFKLSTLIQKRLVALNQGSPALIEMSTDDKMKDRDPGDPPGQDLPGHGVQRPRRRRPRSRAARRKWTSTSYEGPRAAHRRDRRDRRLQDGRPGQPAGAGRGRRLAW